MTSPIHPALGIQNRSTVGLYVCAVLWAVLATVYIVLALADEPLPPPPVNIMLWSVLTTLTVALVVVREAAHLHLALQAQETRAATRDVEIAYELGCMTTEKSPRGSPKERP